VTREQLEHVVRAAAAITGDSEIVVIGSTSILGQFPNAPVEMLGSIEAEISPRNHAERFEWLDVIGEMPTSSSVTSPAPICVDDHRFSHRFWAPCASWRPFEASHEAVGA
jgi:hypothetical protein